MKKIAQIVCTYPPYAGGIGNSAKQLADILEKDHSLSTFHPDNTRPLWRRGHGAIIPQLFWKLKKFDYIYLHYPFFGTAEIVWLFKIFYRRPKLIVHYHMDVKNISTINKILSWPSRLIRKSLLKKADKIVSASLDYIEHSDIKKFYLSHPEKFVEIPFAIDLGKFKPKELHLPSANEQTAQAKKIVKEVNDLYIKRDRLDLVFVGGLDRAHYFKGVNVLLEALSSLRDKNWQLKVIGIGDLLPQYQVQAKELGIDNKIDFLGKLEAETLIRELQNSDTLILPSINSNEAFGIVLIEALACGLSVIASALPGVRSIFKDKEEGLLVKVNDPIDLANKLEFLLNNKDQREEMAKKARRLAEDKYDLRKMIKAYENLFT